MPRQRLETYNLIEIVGLFFPLISSFVEEELMWRDRDSNPGYAMNVNTLSKRAP